VTALHAFYGSCESEEASMVTSEVTFEAPTIFEDQPLRVFALIAGVGTLLIAVLAGIANFGGIERLVVRDDATTTAQNILTSQGTFRFAVAGLVLVAILDVVVAWALFGFFRPVNEGLSRLTAWLRVAYAAVFAVAISQLVGALHLLGDAAYLKTFSVGQLRTEALVRIDSFHDIWSISLVLFGTYLALVGFMAFRSGYVPKFVGVLLVVAGVGYLVDSFGTLLATNYTLKVGSVTSVGEVVLMVWLLVKGRTVTVRRAVPRFDETAPASSGGTT
jgi:uncharacterized protein DUF4386